MLFVKDILFLNGAMATMAPDVDILGEILAVVTYFTERHGEQIAREVGIELLESPSTSTATGPPWGFPTRPTPSPSATCRSGGSSSAAGSRHRAEHRTRRSFVRAVYRLIRPRRD